MWAAKGESDIRTVVDTARLSPGANTFKTILNTVSASKARPTQRGQLRATSGPKEHGCLLGKKKDRRDSGRQEGRRDGRARTQRAHPGQGSAKRMMSGDAAGQADVHRSRDVCFSWVATQEVLWPEVDRNCCATTMNRPVSWVQWDATGISVSAKTVANTDDEPENPGKRKVDMACGGAARYQKSSKFDCESCRLPSIDNSLLIGVCLSGRSIRPLLQAYIAQRNA